MRPELQKIAKMHEILKILMVLGGVAASRTAENHEISQIFMIWGCGVGDAGGSRTIENA